MPRPLLKDRFACAVLVALSPALAFIVLVACVIGGLVGIMHPPWIMRTNDA